MVPKCNLIKEAVPLQFPEFVYFKVLIFGVPSKEIFQNFDFLELKASGMRKQRIAVEKLDFARFSRSRKLRKSLKNILGFELQRNHYFGEIYVY